MAFLAFIIGICIGSFLNVLIYRLPKGSEVILGRSCCPNCKRKIAWYDNIPLLSFIILRGRCRYCKKPITLRYPLVEFLTGVLFLLSYLSQLSNLSYLIIAGSIVIFFIDLEHQIIPDQIVFPLILISLCFSLIDNLQFTICNLLPTAVISYLFFYFLHFATKGRGMGFGDIKLALLIGLIFGFPLAIVTFYLAFLTGAIIGIILILIRKLKFGQHIPFGPFLTSSCLISLFLREKILWAVKALF